MSSLQLCRNAHVELRSVGAARCDIGHALRIGGVSKSSALEGVAP